MKIRIKFRKYGVLKFIGHLDVMRYFQKALRRAEVDISFSGGFSPHPIMSFAAPLGVGLTSDGEYLDIEVNSTESSAVMVKRLNDVMVEGMEIVSYRKLPDKMKSAMSQVAAADYQLTFRKGYEPEDWNKWEEAWKDFWTQSSIIVSKKTKKSEQEVDIRPLVYKIGLENHVIFMKIATGSVHNLKPEFLMEAFYRFADMKWNPFIFQTHRMETYMEGENDFVSLEEAGTVIEME